MAKCSFCKNPIEQGTGVMVIEKTGKVFYFDSKKCEKNLFKLHRDPRRFKWANNE
ncbi:MAG: 50S ribosomal protein L24e [Candidatus Aenigmatarchaeota archaeon]